MSSKRLLHYNFSKQYLSRYSSVSIWYQCLNSDTISLAIEINRKLVTINAKSKSRTQSCKLSCQYGHYQSIDQCLKHDMIHTTTILWTINATTPGCVLVCYFNWTIAIYWSMSQTVHDPPCNNIVNYQRHYHWARYRLLCHLDNSHL